MTDQADLFGGYPHEPGSKPVDTSRDAAAAIRPKVTELRAMVLAEIVARPSTSVQIARRLHQPYETVQPRTSELKRLGLIEDSGKRGASRDPAKTAIIWKAVKT